MNGQKSVTNVKFVTANQQDQRKNRFDIQVLRGFAVLCVVIFHSGLGLMPSGYLGVDVFFVISGFLVGGIIIRRFKSGHLNISGFYARRIRRLIPASHVVFVTCIAAALFLTTASAYELLWQQILGSIAFSTNFILWKQINYFNNAADFEPLLHIWSLAVEEQFYFLFPILLMATPRRFWLVAILLISLISLFSYVYLYKLSPGFAFYLLPTRAWELGIGVLINFFPGSSALARFCRTMSWPAALVLAIVMFTPNHPSTDFYLAIPACLLTATIIAADSAALDKARYLKPMSRIGDISYSLYLVHWPVFSFAHSIYLGAPLPHGVAILLICASFALAFLLYHFVEQPIRHVPASARTIFLALLLSSSAVAIAGFATLEMKRSLASSDALTGVEGLEIAGCTGTAVVFDGRCRQTSQPEILVWGDSFSQHVIPGIDATTARSLAQASKGQCPPFSGFAPVDFDANLRFALGCTSFQHSVIDYVRRTPSIKVVVLSGRYSRFLQTNTDVLIDDGLAPARIVSPTMDEIVKAQKATIDVLRSYGKRVVILAAPPQARFNVGQCWERRRQGLPTSAPKNCSVTPEMRAEWTPALTILMARFGHLAPVIRLDKPLCSSGECIGSFNGQPIYRDGEHLSRAGSLFVGHSLNLGEKVWADAR